MNTIELLTVGQLKNGAEKELYDSFCKRINGAVKLVEIDARKYNTTKLWQDALRPHLEQSKSYKFFLDEKGKHLSSEKFAEKIQELNLHGQSNICFVIGGADGFDRDFIKQYADYTLSLSAMTFPHMMARAFLIEQIYRAQQIIANHPYHRS